MRYALLAKCSFTLVNFAFASVASLDFGVFRGSHCQNIALLRFIEMFVTSCLFGFTELKFGFANSARRLFHRSENFMFCIEKTD
jgi:hypothetical protein